MDAAPITEVSVFAVMCDWRLLAVWMALVIAALVLTGCLTILWMFREGKGQERGNDCENKEEETGEEFVGI